MTTQQRTMVDLPGTSASGTSGGDSVSDDSMGSSAGGNALRVVIAFAVARLAFAVMQTVMQALFVGRPTEAQDAFEAEMQSRREDSGHRTAAVESATTAAATAGAAAGAATTLDARGNEPPRK